MTIVLRFKNELTSAGMLALLDEHALEIKFKDALGDAWSMDNPADKAAAVNAIMHVVSVELANLMPG